MKKLIITILFVSFFSSANSHSLTSIEQCYIDLLANSLGRQSAGLLHEVSERTDTALSEEYLDFLAETLDQEAGKQDYDKKTVKELFKALLLAKNPKYYSLLKKHQSFQGNKKKGEFGVYQLKEASKVTEQFTAKGLDRAGLEKAYIERATNRTYSSDQIAFFKSITKATSPDEIFEKMGQPDAIKANFTSAGVSIGRLSLFYKELGRVVLNMRDTQWLVGSSTLSEIGFESYMPYFNESNLNDETTSNIILKTAQAPEAFAVRHMAGVLDRNPEVDTVFLDAFAQRLHDDMKTQLDDGHDDANAWIIKLLARKNPGRYKELISKAANNDLNPKTQKYAKKFLKKIKKASSDDIFKPV